MPSFVASANFTKQNTGKEIKNGRVLPEHSQVPFGVVHVDFVKIRKKG